MPTYVIFIIATGTVHFIKKNNQKTALMLFLKSPHVFLYHMIKYVDCKM